MARYSVTVEGPEGKVEVAFPSVTEIIDAVYAKNGLADWYYKQAIQGVSRLHEQYGENMPKDIPSLHSLMKNEGYSPYAQRDLAASQGTDIHKVVKQLTSGRTSRAKAEYPALYEWWKSRDFRRANILGAETTLVSFRWQYAGTADLVYTESSSVILADVKSGKVRDSHSLQLEGYRQAWEEMGGHPVDRMSIIQVPRDGSAISETFVEVSDELTEAWAGAVALYRWVKPIKGVV